MLCFDDTYIIETCKKGKRNTYEISIFSDDGASALSVISHKISECKKNGTKLIVKAIKKQPNTEELKNMLSHRFLFDPEFQIYVNNELVDYKEYIDATHNETISIDGNAIDISIYGVPEGEKNTASTGIAFWVGRRLVGNPSWTIDSQRVEDARRKFALKHIILVKADFFT